MWGGLKTKQNKIKQNKHNKKHTSILSIAKISHNCFSKAAQDKTNFKKNFERQSKNSNSLSEERRKILSRLSIKRSWWMYSKNKDKVEIE